MFESEAQALRRVVESLAATFPLIPEAEVREVVSRVHARFADASVRTYLPVLVDRQARQELMHAPARKHLATGR